MKSILLTLLILPFTMFAQNYQPFDAGSPKKFLDPSNAADSGYFFYPMNSTNSGDTTYFEQYFRMSAQDIDVTGTICEGWGGAIQPTMDTTWLGRMISYNSATMELGLTNAAGESLHFDFSLAVGDSAIFYQNVIDTYYIKHTSQNSELILDSLENVKTFQILHYDQVNNPALSPLHGFEIKISENLGLVNFINCNTFPVVEQGLTLTGQINPNLGYYQMTYDETFPWNVGDTIQLKGFNNTQSGTTWHYRLITIDNRVETNDSVWIYMTFKDTTNQWMSGFLPPPYFINYTNPIVYAKGDNIMLQPEDMTSKYGVTYRAGTIDQCGPKKFVSNMGEFIMYCDSCDCMTLYDGFGSSVSSTYHVATRGVTSKSQQLYGAFGEYKSAVIQYSNVGGQTCGEYYTVGLKENEIVYSIYPNPVADQLEIHTDISLMKIELLSITGETVMELQSPPTNCALDVSQLTPGIYLINLSSENGFTTTRIVVE